MKFLLVVAVALAMCFNVNGLTYLEGCLAANEVHMTIDDAPSTNTPAILQAFASRNVSATWFIIGKHVVDLNYYQSIENMMINHTIGTHTYSHTHITSLTAWQLRRELHDNELLFRMITGKRPVYWRAPYFDDDDTTDAIIDEFGYTFFDASMDTLDWGLLNTTLIVNAVENIVQGLNPAYPVLTSYIELEHDWVPETPAALPIVIDYLRSKGFKLVDAVTCTGIQPYIADTNYGPLLTNGLQFNLATMIPHGSGTSRRQLKSDGHSHSHAHAHGRSLEATLATTPSSVGCSGYSGSSGQKSTKHVAGPNDWNWPAPGLSFGAPTTTPVPTKGNHFTFPTIPKGPHGQPNGGGNWNNEGGNGNGGDGFPHGNDGQWNGHGHAGGHP